jgi:CRISPR-associated endonuclease/helicase Cas3
MSDRQDFESFFFDATGFAPYGWQRDLALGGMKEVLPVPTGLGKTEGAVLAWAWRKFRARAAEPLHLVYCLPMRTLVRQTVKRIRDCFRLLVSKGIIPEVPVYLLMGGEIDEKWAGSPDLPWVLVGTQDQLLSRALNRGYAMSRFEWPVHFGLLNHDCHWIVDEVQLMGPGLWTSSQLDWMRRKRFPALKPCRTTWMSATVGTSFLSTTDRKGDGLDNVGIFNPRLEDDENPELRRRLSAMRPADWFKPKSGKRALNLEEQLAKSVTREHSEGTLTLVICNTVDGAQRVFRSLRGMLDNVPDQPQLILLTSRFRPKDRQASEQQLSDFEKRRSQLKVAKIAGEPGVICVSTQVVEAGVDVSARRLWSELAPWPSIIQRLGRLNRDGRDNEEARAYFWKTPKRPGDSEEAVAGPYEMSDLKNAADLLEGAIEPSSRIPFAQVLDKLCQECGDLLAKVLEPERTPLPRALDVHGLFSTEPDVHGGFTDVSSFVRGPDPNADLTVFWRTWRGPSPPQADALEGPSFDPRAEGCSVACYRLEGMLKKTGALAWLWNDEGGRWERCRPSDLRPGMTVMLRRDAGGYDTSLGWTGEKSHVLLETETAGSGHALGGEERTETGGWTSIEVHLTDARREAESICDGVGLLDGVDELKPYRTAVVQAATLHDLGKAHPKWQRFLPARSLIRGGPWAKCPRLLGVDVSSPQPAVAEAVSRLREGALALAPVQRLRGLTRLTWAVDRKLHRRELEELKTLRGVAWAGHVAFRPGMRHEAASALAMWHRSRNGDAEYPALAVYLVAAHHGKVRTVLRATSPDADNVFGVPAVSDPLLVNGQHWPLDFSVSTDGLAGEWRGEEYFPTGFGWTGIVADLLGPWRCHGQDKSNVGAVPYGEPRRLGPFLLAWLEALVRAADWRASAKPSNSISPSEVPRAQ